MSKLSQQDKDCFLDALKLKEMYADKDLAHDGHGLWLLAGDAMRKLTLHYQTPLALRLAQSVVRYYSSQMEAEQARSGSAIA